MTRCLLIIVGSVVLFGATLAAQDRAPADQTSPPPQGKEAPPEEPPEQVFETGLTILAEKDDNVTLGAGLPLEEDPYGTETVLGDTVYRVQPYLKLKLPFSSHKIAVEARAEGREGNSTELHEWNAIGVALADFSFSGGLGLRLFDAYARTAFDQALLIPEAGVSRSTSNTAGGQLSFTPAERFSVEAGGDRMREQSVFGSGDDAPRDERDVSTIRGKLSIPISENWLAYIVGNKVSQDTLFDPNKEYDDGRGAVGLRWDGPARRFFLFLEAGRETVQFLSPFEEDQNNRGVWLAGFEWGTGEETFARAAVGRNAFGETIWQATFSSSSGEKSVLSVTTQRTTQFSISPLSRPTFVGTLGNVIWKRTFMERLSLGATLSWFRLVMVMYDPFDITKEIPLKDDTWMGRGEAAWLISPWLRGGIHYQYSRRDSDLPTNRFVDSRIGVSLQAFY